MYNKLRKMFGPPEPSPIESSDDEYQPHSSNVSKKGNSFAGLEISSSKSESEDSEDSEISEACDIEEKNKSNKKIKLNLKKSEMVEDIDQIVQEVNATLGEMSPQKDPSTLKKINTFETVFSVKKVYLKFTNERHNFLPPHKGKKNRKKQIDGIVENPITELKGPFKHKGISMSIVRIENGINYFVYNHNPSYQQQHKRMIEYLLDRDRQDEDSIIYCLQNMHVEGIIESCSIYCNANNYQDAMKFLEEVIAYLHFVADPLFNISNGKTRLEYKYLENRTYHIAVLQYSFFVGAMGYERTALELVKMLLTLDPTDPLAIVCIIDSFALKAGEFEWLIDAVDVLDKERDAKLLYNIKYSYALAHFNVLSKNKEDLKLADDLLKDAIMSFPSGPMAILSNVGLSKEDQRTERIRKHSLFNDYAFKSTSKQLYQLIGFYGALNGQCWQKWSVLEWLIRNAHELMDSYDNDPQTKDEFKRHERIRRTLFKACPFEVLRQLWVIKDMAGHLKVKDAMPTLPLDPLFSFNPVPPMGDNTVNRYGYKEMICLNYY